MKKCLLTTLLLCLLGQVFAKDSNHESDKHSNQQATSPVSQAHQQARKLNTKGFRLYRQGQYYQALPLFKKATQADKNYVFGQYNLACTASIVLTDFDCGHDDLLEFVDFDLIITALKQAISLDPKRRAKSQTDPDLALVRKSFRYYHEILGYSIHNDQQLKAMLVGIDWQTEFRWYHAEPIGQLMFSTDGQVTLKTAAMIEGEIPRGSKPWTNSYRRGRYQVSNGTVTLIFNSDRYGRQQITGQLDNQGVLRFDGAANAKILPADSYQFIKPEPCSA